MNKKNQLFVYLMAIALFSGVAVAAGAQIYLASNNVGPFTIDPIPVQTTLIANLTGGVTYPWGTVANLTAVTNPATAGVSVQFRNQYEAPLAAAPTNLNGIATVFLILQNGTWTLHAQPMDSP